MSTITEIAILVLAAFVGFEVISKVPNTLHTPLMSGTNAIHGIILVGALIIAGDAHTLPGYVLGFVVTDRMLHMFKRRREPDEQG